MRKYLFGILFFCFSILLTDGLLAQTPPLESSANTLTPESVLALPEVVVTANRLQTPVSQVANSMTVITAKDIEQKQSQTVLDALQGVPGLTLLINGSAGENSGVFIRGADSGHTLMLLDGIPINNPISPSRDFEYLDQIFADDVSRIEVFRGPLSTLYGTNATAGVVNIITKQGVGDPRGSFLFENGAYQSFREALNASAGNNLGNFAFSFSRFDTQGFPSADKNLGNSVNSLDGNSTAYLRLGILPSPSLDNSLFVRYSDSRTNLAAFGGVGGDDPNFFLDERQWTGGTQTKWKLFDGIWEQVLGISFSDDLQKFTDDFSTFLNSHYERGVYEGQAAQISWQNNLRLWKGETLMGGIEGKQEWGRVDDTTDYGYGPSNALIQSTLSTASYFLESQTGLLERLYLTIGGRVDDVGSFGSQLTYRGALAYFVPELETKLKATFGTGFKAPSIYQFYSPYGNTGLLAEKSEGWDAGFEQPLADGIVKVGATYFHNEFTNLIEFESTATPPYGQYFNVDKALTEGWETFALAKPSKDLEVKASYTYTWAVDEGTGLQLERRPQNQADFSASYQWGTVNLGIDWVYVGDRPDVAYTNFTSNPVTLSAYNLVNLLASYQINEHLKFFGRVNNLLNQAYEEIYGYGTPGLSVYLGTKVSL